MPDYKSYSKGSSFSSRREGRKGLDRIDYLRRPMFMEKVHLSDQGNWTSDFDSQRIWPEGFRSIVFTSDSGFGGQGAADLLRNCNNPHPDIRHSQY